MKFFIFALFFVIFFISGLEALIKCRANGELKAYKESLKQLKQLKRLQTITNYLKDNAELARDEQIMKFMHKMRNAKKKRKNLKHISTSKMKTLNRK